MEKTKFKINEERLRQLIELSKILPGMQVLDKHGRPIYDVGYKEITYGELGEADKKKYAHRKNESFKRIVKNPRYIKHFPELIGVYKKGGSEAVEKYVDWCNQVAKESQKAALTVRTISQMKHERAATENEVMLAKVDMMISEANG